MKEFIIPNEIKTVLNKLYESGFSAYIVGGCVRDIIMGIEPNDYDITSSATPEQTLEVFSDFRTYELGRKFGTITVVSGGYHVEITTMRTEKGYADGRRPDEVIFTDSIMEDAARRDFTINAMAYSLKEGFFDGFGGVDDVRSRRIKAVGEGERRFTEDGLRIMRALRFAARFGFEIEEKTAEALRKCVCMLDNIAKERIKDELDRLIVSPYTEKILDEYFDIICHIIPELRSADKKTMALRVGNMENDRVLRLSALLADTGEKAEDILKDLRYSREDIESISAVIMYKDEPISSDADIRRLMKKTGYEKARLVLRYKKDEECLKKLESAKNQPYRLKDLAVNGKDVAELGIKGENIGIVLNKLLDDVIADPSHNTREQLLINIRSYIE